MYLFQTLTLTPTVARARRAVAARARLPLAAIMVAAVASAMCGCGDVSLVDGQDASPPAPSDAAVADAGAVIDAAPAVPDAEPVPADANPNTITITHSNSEIVQDGRAFFCGDEADPPHHVNNSYFRVFDLDDFDVAGDFEISAVRFGVELARAEDGAVEQDARLFFYTLPEGDGFRYANLDLLDDAEFTVPNQQLKVFEVPVSIEVPASSQLVVELAIPNGEFDDRFFYVGFNGLGQTGPTYLVAPTCGDLEPTDLAELDGADAHLILSVLGVDRGASSGQ